VGAVGALTLTTPGYTRGMMRNLFKLMAAKRLFDMVRGRRGRGSY
jgi:hypothetical protein